VRIDFGGVDFGGVNFSGVDLRCIDLGGVDFDGFDFDDVNFVCLDSGDVDLGDVARRKGRSGDVIVVPLHVVVEILVPFAAVLRRLRWGALGRVARFASDDTFGRDA
jgi:hypothetical protein